MKILFLTSRLPYPPDRGDRLRAYHFLRNLSTRHEIDLVSFIADESEQEYADYLLKHCSSVDLVLQKPVNSILEVVKSFWRPDPLQNSYYRSRKMYQLVEQKLREHSYDVAFVHLFRMAPYVENKGDLYRIIDLTDVISLEIERSLPYRGILSSLLYNIEQPRIEATEQKYAKLFEETWLISEYDRGILAEKCPTANIRVIPNGVELEGLEQSASAENPKKLIFVGHMSVFHNIDAVEYLVRDVLPLVRKEIPDVTLDVVGAQPHTRVQSLSVYPGVSVRGFVPDLSLALQQASVFVAPLRFAAGIQNKILEAMAAAKPVITTAMINESLDARPGEDILLAESPSEFASQIILLLNDRPLRHKIGSAGKGFVTRKFSWEHVLRRMDQIEREIKLIR